MKNKDLNMTEKDIKRFWSKVDVKGPDECWEWKSSLRRGYGRLRIGKKCVSAHRISYLINIGDIKKENYILHTCDNPKCVNPNHLKSGSQKENCQDCVSKGRHSWTGKTFK